MASLLSGDVSEGSDQSEAPAVTNDQSEAAPPPACLVIMGWTVPGPDQRRGPNLNLEQSQLQGLTLFMWLEREIVI